MDILLDVLVLEQFSVLSNGVCGKSSLYTSELRVVECKVFLETWVVKDGFVVFDSGVFLDVVVKHDTWVLVVVVGDLDTWVLVGVVGDDDTIVGVVVISDDDSWVCGGCLGNNDLFDGCNINSLSGNKIE